MNKTVKAEKDQDVIDPKFFNLVSQFAHFFTMYSLTFTIGFLTGPVGLWIAFGLCVAYAAWHEFYWDPRHEDALTRGSDLEDFCFLVGGSVVAVIVYLSSWALTNAGIKL